MTDNTFYVYSHVDPRDNSRPYIGIGQYDRAWCCRRNQRKEDHVLWLEELYKEGYTLADIVRIEHNKLTKKEALEIEANIIKTEKPKLNELGNPDHWQRGRTWTRELSEFAKALHGMGYGYVRISQLMGGEGLNHMTFKRMVKNVAI
jgi:hypothetical protein